MFSLPHSKKPVGSVSRLILLVMLSSFYFDTFTHYVGENLFYTIRSNRVRRLSVDGIRRLWLVPDLRLLVPTKVVKVLEVFSVFSHCLTPTDPFKSWKREIPFLTIDKGSNCVSPSEELPSDRPFKDFPFLVRDRSQRFEGGGRGSKCSSPPLFIHDQLLLLPISIVTHCSRINLK